MGNIAAVTDADLAGKGGDLPGLGLVECDRGIHPLGPLAHGSDLDDQPRASDGSQDVDLPPSHTQISSEDPHPVLDEKTDSDLLGSPTDLSR